MEQDQGTGVLSSYVHCKTPAQQEVGLLLLLSQYPSTPTTKPFRYKHWGSRLCLSVFRCGDIIVIIAIQITDLIVVYVDDVIGSPFCSLSD